MVLGTLAIHLWKNKLDLYPSPCAEINTKWIRELNVRPETIKLSEEKQRKYPWQRSGQ